MTDGGDSIREGATPRHAGIAAADDTTAARGDSLGQRRPWQIAEQLPNDVLKGISGCTPVQVQVLHNRQIRGADAIRAFLQADWHSTEPHLLDLDRATDRIHQAIQRGEHIVVFGDYDCDGLTSCALLVDTLRSLGAHVESYVPRREDDGRGLNLGAVDDLSKQGAKLIITTDCGTANVEETEQARSLGIDVIVTDHHPPHGPLPQAVALVNPRRLDDTSRNKDLAGVGVAFRLAERLLRKRAPDGVATAALTRLLDLVALGTIGDIVPLSPENWALAHVGLRQLNHTSRPGLLALIRSAGLRLGEITTRDISFSIAPRLNAAGRLGEPLLAVQLLLAKDHAEAEEIAARLEALNLQRQSATETVLAEARSQISGQHPRHVVIVQGDEWTYGVLGLVAGRLSEDYHLPAFVISRSNGECRGSARGPQGMDLGHVLAARPEFFRRFGGHAQAAGFTLAAGELEAFLAYLDAHFSATRPDLIMPSALHVIPTDTREAGQSAQQSNPDDSGTTGAGANWPSDAPLIIDCRLPLRRVVPDVAEALALLAPFGQGFEEPVFVCENVRILRCWQSGTQGRNLRLVLRDGSVERVALWPRQGPRCDDLRRHLPDLPPLDIAYTIQSYRNRYNDSVEVVLRIIALRPTQPQPTDAHKRL